MVVEDDTSTRDAMALLLEDEGYSVSAAENGVIALARAREQTPDLIISDVCMPGGDGFKLVAELRKQATTEHIPVLLISALDGSNRRINGLDLGADDFLTKPVDPMELLARIRAHLRHSRRMKDLMRGASTDVVTAVLNRRGVMQALAEELKRANRGTALSILLTDVDDFKAINDSFGHPAGDEVLRHVANCLTHTARSGDHVGRLGGDEFVLVLSGSNVEGASSAAKRFRATIEQEIALGGGRTVIPRVSIGQATYRTGMTEDELIARADESMYADKNRRRKAKH